MLDLPVHLNPFTSIDCGDVVLRAGRLDLHCPVEIFRLESSRPTTRVDLSLNSSWLNPHVGISCVLDRLEVIQLVLVPLSQNPMQMGSFSYLPRLRTYHRAHQSKPPIAFRATADRISMSSNHI